VSGEARAMRDTRTERTSPATSEAAGGVPVETLLEARAREVDDALRTLDALEIGAVRAGHALKDAIERFHRDGLTQLIRGLRQHPAGIEALQAAAASDPFVQALLTMHGLVRPGIDDRLRRAIDVVRPLLHQHGGDVEFVRREDDVVFVRLHGSCTECSLAPETLDHAVHEAIKKEAPEIRRIELVRDHDAEPAGEAVEHPGEGWEPGPVAAEVPDDRLLRFDLTSESVVFSRIGGEVRAWRNACPHQGLPIDGAWYDRTNCAEGEVGSLVCPWHSWSFDPTTGRCKNYEARLEPVPLIIRGGIAWVRP
jgi:nitrite reductase/ring-hydroxylating ferredoxin subunit/Fe-S cluster biogenesis protein NfuA